MTDELLEQFVVEGRELTQQLADDLLALEATPGETARLDGAFRAFHTLKGSAGIFSFGPMETVLHAAEDLAGALRDGRMALSAGVLDALLACVGKAESWIDAVAADGTLPADAADDARALATRLRSPLGAPDAPVAAQPAKPSGPVWLPTLLARHPGTAEGAQPLTALRYIPTADCFFRGDDPLALLRDVPGLLALDVREREPSDPASLDPFACNLVIEALSASPGIDVRPIFRLVPDQVEIAAVPRAGIARAPAVDLSRERSLRVDVARIDKLADIAAELIVAKNRLGHLARAAETSPEGLSRALLSNQADIERLVGELHRAVSAARMVPLGQTLQRLPRLVRETAGRLGKTVRLDLQGTETEAEKRIADGLFEPLLHTLRNAVDHGIEPAGVRRQAGKPEEGRIVVRASLKGDRVVIEVSDDGAGIDPAAVRRTVLERGLMDAAALDALDEAGMINLIFAPGFSTAGTVSDISGRGVGLDAVRSSLAAMGGRVDVASERGAGATVRFTVPQAIVITTLIQVTAGGQSFGIPLQAVAETLRLPAPRIVAVKAGAAFALKGATIPLLQLTDLLGLGDKARTGRDAKIVIVRSGEDLIGVEVAAFGERLDVVLRPIRGLLAGMPGLLGSALMGDGSVMLVLDLPALVA